MNISPFSFFVTIFLVLFNSSISKAQEQSLQGTWDIVEIAANEPIMLHKDAPSTNLISKQMDCFGGTMVFSADGRALRSTKKNDCSISTCEMSYTISGNKVTIVGPQTKTGSYKYFQGKLILLGIDEVYDVNFKRWVPVNVHLKKKSEDALIPKRTYPDGFTVKEIEKSRFEIYGTEGLLVQKLKVDNCNRQWNKTLFEYDDQKRLIRKRAYFQTDDQVKQEIYIYTDEDDLPDTILYYSNTFNKKEEVVSLKYDKRERVIKKTSSNKLSNSKTILNTTYSKSHKKEDNTEWVNSEGELVSSESVRFNKNEDVISRDRKYVKAPDQNNYYEAEYNDKNHIIRSLMRIKRTTEERFYTYNLEGGTVNIIKNTLYNSSGKITTSENTYYLKENNKPDYNKHYSEDIPVMIIEPQE